jgi:hypothetical protein
LDGDACHRLLAEKDVTGSESEKAKLTEAYEGNPLALKIVAQTIVELFNGEIVPFLEQGEVIFGGVRQLLNEQFTAGNPARTFDVGRSAKGADPSIGKRCAAGSHRIVKPPFAD